MRRLVAAVASVLLGMAAAALSEDDIPRAPPEPIALGATLPASVRVTPVGRGAGDATASLASLGGDAAKPLVVLVWSARCPVCRRYESVVKALAKDYEGRARLCVLFPNSTETDADARAWLDASGATCVAATDRTHEVAPRLGAFVTPTALVFDASGALRYRGPVDDDRRARRRDTTDHLRVALESVLAGKPVENPEPRAFGSSVRPRRSDQR